MRRFGIRFAPNPIRDSGFIHYRLSDPSEEVTIRVLDPSGRQVQQWSLTPPGAGSFQLPWLATDRSGRDLPAGAYFYRAQAGKDETSGRFLILR
jgi:flagellar hook assembly protein FlgD